MKLLSKISVCLVLATVLVLGISDTNAQTKYPKPSQKAMLMQTIGDTDVMITYHRPNIKGRILWGSKQDKALVPNGEIWRAGANEATVFEVTNDVLINGEKLAKGKYSFYVIPNNGEWTLIFNKSWDQWGTIYDETKDALRVMTKPVKSDVSVESLRYTVENVLDNQGDVHLAWGNARIPFTIDVGDVDARIMASVQSNIISEQMAAIGYIVNNDKEEQYKMALGWVNNMLSNGDSYGPMFYKARLLGAMGMKKEALEAANKAIVFGKANKVSPRSIAFLENEMAKW